MTNVSRHEVQNLSAQGATVIDVLPAGGYKRQHLPKAINVPLSHFTSEWTAQFARDVPLVVYCFDGV